jgi:hypothetical protein
VELTVLLRFVSFPFAGHAGRGDKRKSEFARMISYRSWETLAGKKKN